MTVAVLLVSLPDRHGLLKEALDSVSAQTRQPDDILVGVDPYRLGEAENMNRLARATDCDFYAFLHDDDLWEPNHLEELLAFTAEADVVVASFDTPGRPANTIERHHCDYSDLLRTNWFPPSAVIVSAEAFWAVGGFRPTTPPSDWVDWSCWRRLHEHGARFACSHRLTMHYRFGDWSNGSWRG